MFEAIVEHTDRRGRRIRRLLIAFLGVHGVGIGIAILLDQLRVSAVREPAVAITFVDFAQASPPPPPPPPPKKRSTPKKVETKPTENKPKEFVAPKEIPQAEPPPEKEDDSGSDDGVVGGVEGGVVGGVVGGAVGNAPAPPPPPKPAAPPPPVQQDQSTFLQRRVQGQDVPYPPAMERRQIEGVVEAKITVSADGRVTDIVILKATPGFEAAVRQVVMGWKFRPFLVNGQPAPTSGVVRFKFGLQE